MTNLDGILKSTDIILPTNVHLVKSMVFLVVMYGCESWTIKTAEHLKIDVFDSYIGEDSTHGHNQMVNTKIRLIIFFVAKMEKLYTVSKNKTGSQLQLRS